MAERARPTLRCLREDLGLPVPRADTPLDEITHLLLEKATERFADDQTPHERISSIDDQVLLKVKVQRWRGAVWVDADLPWLVAAGHREEGSPDDFYAALATRAQAARARYNAEHTPPLASGTYTAYLLPGHDDELRWRADHAVAGDPLDGLGQRPAQHPRALLGDVTAGDLGMGLTVLRCQPGPRAQLARVPEPAHVADLGHDDRGQDRADAGQLLDDLSTRGRPRAGRRSRRTAWRSRWAKLAGSAL